MHDQIPGAEHPTFTLPSSSPADPYLITLSPDGRAAYRVASPDADLSNEIRLLRAALSSLAEDLPGNHRSIVATVNALVRALTFQARQLGDAPPFVAELPSGRSATPEADR